MWHINITFCFATIYPLSQNTHSEQAQCCGGRCWKEESKYVYGMQSVRRVTKVPRNCSPCDANGFSTPIVSQIAQSVSYGQQHMINRSLSLSLSRSFSFVSFSCSAYHTHLSLCLFLCAANSIKQTIRESFITRTWQPFFLLLLLLLFTIFGRN